MTLTYVVHYQYKEGHASKKFTDIVEANKFAGLNPTNTISFILK
jgi:hypothetical protein